MTAHGSVAEVPALALVGASRELERVTDNFRLQYGHVADALPRDSRIDEVLNGSHDRANFVLKGVAVNVEAVTDAFMTRWTLVMVHSAAGSEPAPSNDVNPLLGA